MISTKIALVQFELSLVKFRIGEHYHKMLQIFLTLLLSIIGLGDVYSAVSLREPSRNSILPSGGRGTLDMVKVLGHVKSGRCLVVENGRRHGVIREHQLVLWKCHDEQIKGLEQEMFSLVKSNGGGYLLMGYAGSLDKCVAAEMGYNDHVVIRKCNPNDENQTWVFRRVDLSSNKYQLVQLSTGRCVRAPGLHDGAWVRVGDCDYSDERQLWNVCGLDGACDF